MTEIEAIIEAAHIQGNSAFWGAIIGSLALIVSIWLGSYLGLKGYKTDKLAEAKRDVYLELVQDWQSFIMTLSSYQAIELKEAYLSDFRESLSKVLGSLHKASFVSDPSTKEKILEFSMDLSRANFKFRQFIERWYALDEGSPNRLQVLLEFLDYLNPIGLNAMKLQIILRNELGLKENDSINQRILNSQKDFAKETRDRLRSILGNELS